jgi:glycosyltransferase involved in cell wall biosynthesis
MKVTLVVLAWNEVESMPIMMPKIDKSLFEQILVIDGGSTDGTIKWCEDNGYEIYVQKQRGLRKAYQEAMPLIRGDVLLTFSPDGNSIPEDLPKIIDKIKEGYDMVIASRYLGTAKSEDDGFVTAFGNWFFTTLTNVLFGGKYTDAFVIYRAYKKEIFYTLGFDKDDGFTIPEKLFSTRVSIEPLLSARAAKRKLKIAEVPSDEPARIGGERKLQVIRWGLTFLYQLIAERLKK